MELEPLYLHVRAGNVASPILEHISHVRKHIGRLDQCLCTTTAYYNHNSDATQRSVYALTIT
jgi:hypothetical protein